MYSVYMHECTNGKKYVGITSKPCEERWKNGKGYQNNRHFTQAINKYGWDNIKHIILWQGKEKEIACELEKHYIKLFDLTNREKGYNSSTGGEKSSEGFKHTEEAKRKISDANKGKTVSPESIELTMKKRRRRVKVFDYNLNLIKICNSLTDAEKLTGVDNSNISAVCKGRYKQFKGYVFQYADDDSEIEPPRSHRRPVNMYDMNGCFIRQWETIKEAALYAGVADTHIGDCCKGKIKKSGGYVWKYA